MVVATIKTMTGAVQGRLIIFGAGGMLGHALSRSFSLARSIGREVDITDREAVWHEVITIRI